MELSSRLLFGLQTASSGPHLLAITAGSLLGLWIGQPGRKLSVPAVIALLLPLVPLLDAGSVLMLLLGIHGASAFCAGMPSSRGSAGRPSLAPALAAAGAALLGSLAIGLLAPLLIEWSFHFGAAENFSLMLLCLVLACALADGSLLASLAMAVLGLLLTQIGRDPVFGTPRFLVELPEMARGIGLIPLAIGLFAGAEWLARLDPHLASGPPAAAALPEQAPTGPERWALLRAAWRGAGIGLVLGLLPGSAPRLARACAAASERRLALRGDDEMKAGQGRASPRSRTGAAAAGQAATQIGILPMLAFGVPTNAVFALVAAALSLKGLPVGPLLLTAQPQWFWGLIVSMGIAALCLLLLAMAGLQRWRLQLPPAGEALVLLLPAALGVSLSAVNPVVDMAVLTLAMLAGYCLRKLDCRVEPLLLAFVLGPAMEDALRRALRRADGDWAVFLDRPLSLCLLGVAAMLVLAAMPPRVRQWRDRVFAGRG